MEKNFLSKHVSICLTTSGKGVLVVSNRIQVAKQSHFVKIKGSGLIKINGAVKFVGKCIESKNDKKFD